MEENDDAPAQWPAARAAYTPLGFVTGLALASTVLFLSGCAGPQSLLYTAPPTEVIDRQGVDALSQPAGRRTTYFKDHGSIERFCRDTSPDFAITASEGISLGVGPVGRGVANDESRGAMGLGGRNPEVLVARELLYRACELSLNINADPKLTLHIYERFLKTIERLAHTQTAAGSAPLAGNAGDTRTSLGSPPASDPATVTGDSDTPPGALGPAPGGQ